MERLKCKVDNCERKAIVNFCGNWICGDCFIKINEKIKKQNSNMLEGLWD